MHLRWQISAYFWYTAHSVLTMATRISASVDPCFTVRPSSKKSFQSRTCRTIILEMSITVIDHVSSGLME